MELIGRYSNRSSLLQAPARQVEQSGEASEASAGRRGMILATVSAVLREAGEPLRVNEIHVRAERALGRAVAYRSIKNALSVHSRGEERRFNQARWGWYELAK
jgi:hypothetical protein